MNSENFVVETLISVFNDNDTRVDDEVTFADLTNVSLMFIQAALEYVPAFKEGDMPVLPSEAEYDEALKGNTDLVIEPQKFKKQFVNTKPDQQSEHKSTTDRQDAPSDSQAIDAVDNFENSAANSTATKSMTIPSSAPAAFYSSGKATTSHETQRLVDNSTNDVRQKPTSASVKSKPQNLRAYSLLNTLAIKTPQFKVDESLPVIADLSAENYVSVTLNNEAREANEFLTQTKQTFTFSVQSQVLDMLSDIEKERDSQVANLLAIDQSENISNTLHKALDAKYANILEADQETAKHEYDESVVAENQRHEQALQDLEDGYKATKATLVSKNNKTKEAEYLTEYDKEMSVAKQAVSDQVKQLITDFESKADNQAMTVIESLAGKASNQLSEIFNRFETQIEARRSGLVDERQQYLANLAETEKAQANNRTMDDLEAKNAQLTEAAQAANRRSVEEISLKDKRISDLEKTNSDLVAKVDSSDKTIENLKSASETASTILSSIPANLIQGKDQSSVEDTLEKFIQRQLESQKKPRNGWKVAFVGLASLFGIGVLGGGTFFAVNQIDANHNAELKELSDKDKAERAALKKQVVALQKQVKSSASSATTGSTSANSTTTNVSAGNASAETASEVNTATKTTATSVQSTTGSEVQSSAVQQPNNR